MPFFTGWWQKTCQVVGCHLWAWWKESVSNFNINWHGTISAMCKNKTSFASIQCKKISIMLKMSAVSYISVVVVNCITVLHTDYWTFINSIINLNSFIISNWRKKYFLYVLCCILLMQQQEKSENSANQSSVRVQLYSSHRWL